MIEIIRQKVNQINPEIIDHRRWLHKNAELSFQEYKTSEFIAKTLCEMDGGLEISRPTPTSVLAALKTGKPGPVIALRADIDALPMTENNDLPYKSMHEGVMHACGHDGHAAILLGTAKVLIALKNSLSGEVRFIFQHAEETPPGGAIELVKAGAVNNVDEIYGLHLVSVLETGQFGIRSGTLTSATDKFSILVKGSGGHSSMPYACKDPITTGAEIITALQTILSRKINTAEQAVLSICQVQAGSAYNIIPDEMSIIGSVRTFSESVRSQIERNIREIAIGIAAAHGLEAPVDYAKGYDSVVNDPELTRFIEKMIGENYGSHSIEHIDLVMPGEDFSAFHKNCPAFFLELGAGNKAKGITSPHHNPNYLMDEDALKTGVEFFALTVLERMKAWQTSG